MAPRAGVRVLRLDTGLPSSVRSMAPSAVVRRVITGRDAAEPRRGMYRVPEEAGEAGSRCAWAGLGACKGKVNTGEEGGW